MHIKAVPNKEKTGFYFPSEYNKATFLEWLKKYKEFHIEPVIEESRESRGYLEGAVVKEYCWWQYGIDPRAKGKTEQRRFLFKRDFNYEIVEDRDGNPVRAPLSSKGKAKKITDAFVYWAEQNGGRVPNPELYKLWRDKYSIDPRFPTFHEFLHFLGLECDAMPSSEHLKMLEEDDIEIEYPDDVDPDKVAF